MDQLRRQAAEMAVRMLASTDDELIKDPRLLDDLEQLVTQVFKAVTALKARKFYSAGERSGAWRIFKSGT